MDDKEVHVFEGWANIRGRRINVSFRTFLGKWPDLEYKKDRDLESKSLDEIFDFIRAWGTHSIWLYRGKDYSVLSVEYYAGHCHYEDYKLTTQQYFQFLQRTNLRCWDFKNCALCEMSDDEPLIANGKLYCSYRCVQIDEILQNIKPSLVEEIKRLESEIGPNTAPHWPAWRRDDRLRTAMQQKMKLAIPERDRYQGTIINRLYREYVGDDC